MDSQSWIERYSYFGIFEDFLINGAGWLSVLDRRTLHILVRMDNQMDYVGPNLIMDKERDNV